MNVWPYDVCDGFISEKNELIDDDRNMRLTKVKKNEDNQPTIACTSYLDKDQNRNL